MTPDFIAAVLDTLLPGEPTAPHEAAPLPTGTTAGLRATDYAAPHGPVFDAIAAQAGGIEAFIRADETARATILQAVERTVPEVFRSLLVAVLSDYHESTPVLAALGWHVDSPQPQGHDLPRFDDEAARLLQQVTRRAKLWRA